MNWYGSFRFHSVEGDEPCFVLDEVDSDALRLFRRVRTQGHVYRVDPEQPLASLQIASEIVEQEHGPAPLRCYLPQEMLQTIRQRIGQRASRPAGR